jgi:hypothetical protein
MGKLERKLIDPASTLIEQTAADMCAAWFETALSNGYTFPEGRSHKKFVHNHIEKFIPIACETLVGMLSLPDGQVSVEMKTAITEAILERANDPDLVDLSKPKSPFDFEKVKPLVINTPKKDKH